ncbi:hypothetical protein B296_00050777 [Ensete ventricosum]|uniref:Uncharacterized protein n=1 Tax=Ensete ventricosum TaxID=4639 RepID=A0A426X9L7_ENSVE|nr:hypothetical protein B296_00050777 [Ensete ventricosum]
MDAYLLTEIAPDHIGIVGESRADGASRVLVPIEPPNFKQFIFITDEVVVGAKLRESTVLYNGDHVDVPDSGQAVRDDDGGPTEGC